MSLGGSGISMGGVRILGAGGCLGFLHHRRRDPGPEVALHFPEEIDPVEQRSKPLVTFH